jgi:hypothetical protein
MKSDNLIESVYGIRSVTILIILIFVSSWLSCGTPDILDAVRTRIERKEK